MASLEHKLLVSLLVTAADKAHNARDMMLDARRDDTSWSRFNSGFDGTAWYLLRIHQTLSKLLPGSRSNELLGEVVNEILLSPPYERVVPPWPHAVGLGFGLPGTAEAMIRAGFGVIGLTPDPLVPTLSRRCLATASSGAEGA